MAKDKEFERNQTALQSLYEKLNHLAEYDRNLKFELTLYRGVLESEHRRKQPPHSNRHPPRLTALRTSTTHHHRLSTEEVPLAIASSQAERPDGTNAHSQADETTSIRATDLSDEEPNQQIQTDTERQITSSASTLSSIKAEENERPRDTVFEIPSPPGASGMSEVTRETSVSPDSRQSTNLTGK